MEFKHAFFLGVSISQAVFSSGCGVGLDTASLATHQGWTDIKALGAKIPATQTSGIAAAPASAYFAWNPMTSKLGSITGYAVYRGTSSGGESLNSPIGTTSTLNFTDTTVESGTTYYYLVEPILGNGNPLATSQSFSELKIAVPPSNMALMHRWIANQ